MADNIRNIYILLKRELRSCFNTPIAYVFLVSFLFLNGLFTFYIGNFFARSQADLLPFFSFHPWLYMVFVPAITMRSWSEERKAGTIELLFTLPITPLQAVLSKFFATLLFILLALVLTTPIWVSVNYLGNPDNGIIFASYLGSVMMSAAFIAISLTASAVTKNQVIAFIISVTLCLLFNISGFSLVVDSAGTLLPPIILDTINSFSFLANFDSITKGLIEFTSILYFSSIVLCGLFANIIVIEMKKAD